MNYLIIEDEGPAARRLLKMIQETAPELENLAILDSVESSIAWFQQNEMPDLLFLDIQLSDGLSFELFKSCPIDCPVIFTTAYDEYALQAFKLNSIDYLLKPIIKEDLQGAIAKFNKNKMVIQKDWQSLIEELKPKNYKSRFLLKKGQGFIPVNSEEIAYFHAQEKMVILVTHHKEQFVVDETLDSLEKSMNPKYFYRANRSYLVSAKSVKELRNSFNGKLKLLLEPKAPDEEIFVSRDRASDFKEWLNQ